MEKPIRILDAVNKCNVDYYDKLILAIAQKFDVGVANEIDGLFITIMDKEEPEPKPDRAMNLYEKACREFLKGCMCAGKTKPQDCPQCLGAFVERIIKLTEKGKGKG